MLNKMMEIQSKSLNKFDPIYFNKRISLQHTI